MSASSVLAIAAQMACYSGGILMNWEDVMNSKRSYALPHYGWNVEPPMKPGSDRRHPTSMQGTVEFERWQI